MFFVIVIITSNIYLFLAFRYIKDGIKSIWAAVFLLASVFTIMILVNKAYTGVIKDSYIRKIRDYKSNGYSFYYNGVEFSPNDENLSSLNISEINALDAEKKVFVN